MCIAMKPWNFPLRSIKFDCIYIQHMSKAQSILIGQMIWCHPTGYLGYTSGFSLTCMVFFLSSVRDYYGMLLYCMVWQQRVGLAGISFYFTHWLLHIIMAIIRGHFVCLILPYEWVKGSGFDVRPMSATCRPSWATLDTLTLYLLLNDMYLQILWYDFLTYISLSLSLSNIYFALCLKCQVIYKKFNIACPLEAFVNFTSINATIPEDTCTAKYFTINQEVRDLPAKFSQTQQKSHLCNYFFWGGVVK